MKWYLMFILSFLLLSGCSSLVCQDYFCFLDAVNDCKNSKFDEHLNSLAINTTYSYTIKKTLEGCHIEGEFIDHPDVNILGKGYQCVLPFNELNFKNINTFASYITDYKDDYCNYSDNSSLNEYNKLLRSNRECIYTDGRDCNLDCKNCVNRKGFCTFNYDGSICKECMFNKDCKEGFICISDYCLNKSLLVEGSPCDTHPDTCQGDLACLELTLSYSYCVNKSNQVKGAKCNSDDTCKDGFVCVKDKSIGFCENKSLQKDDAMCYNDKDCADDFICLQKGFELGVCKNKSLQKDGAVCYNGRFDCADNYRCSSNYPEKGECLPI